MSPSDEVRITLAKGPYREAALAFISRTYAARFGTSPSDDFEDIFIALLGGRIVGTFAANPWNPDKPIKLARIHRFIEEATPIPVVPEEIVELGRWIVRVRGVSNGLILRAASHCLKIGRKTGWCEHGENVHRAALVMSLKFHKVTSVLNWEEIAESDKAFYKSEPTLALYMIDLEHIVAALSERVESNFRFILE